jgi:hypothetical protein
MVLPPKYKLKKKHNQLRLYPTTESIGSVNFNEELMRQSSPGDSTLAPVKNYKENINN